MQIGKLKMTVPENAEPFKRAIAARQLQIICRGKRNRTGHDLRNFFGNPDQSSRVAKRQTAQKHRINDAENCGIRPYAQRQGRNDDGGKSRPFPDTAKSVAYILAQIHLTSPRAIDYPIEALRSKHLRVLPVSPLGWPGSNSAQVDFNLPMT